MSSMEFKMPKMGESITEGTIISWLVKEGESFQEGDILLEVATDKVDNEVPASSSGIMEKILFQASDVVPVGEVIAHIKVVDGGASVGTEKIPQEEVGHTRERATDKKPSKKQSAVKAQVNNNTFFSPLVVSIAKEQHISYEELARIPATGKEGRLRKSDVFRYLDEGRPYRFVQPAADPDPTAYRIPQLNLDKGSGKIVEMDRMRQMIADHMVYSKHTSPHVTAYVEADLTDLVQWRNANKAEFQKKYGEKLTFTPLFVEAVAKAIKDFPMINVSVDGTQIIVKEAINIGMATALPNGNLIVPVVRNADQKNLKQLASEVNVLASKARDNKLSGDDIKDSTFTISNVGTFGSLMGTPIINQPEVAILAMGIIKKRPEVITTEQGDEIAIRSMMYLSLSFDHRVVDGYLGGSFLKRIADYLEKFDVTRTL
ncbi:dihydrolipoamide acetyltransferase family protein [Flavobacteriaceae bacterium 3-367]